MSEMSKMVGITLCMYIVYVKDIETCFTHNFLNIQRIFNPEKVLES